MFNLLLQCIIFPVLIISQFVICIEREMTTSIEAGSKDCFYQYIKSGETIDIEYQVIDGGHGDLDIRFSFVFYFFFNMQVIQCSFLFAPAKKIQKR